MKLRELYQKNVLPELQKALGNSNRLAVPRVTHVVLNVGLGPGLKEAKFLETAEATLRRVTGQQPVKTKARKAISNFKIRQGQVIGMQVTLRGKRMWDFLDKLIRVTLPRVRDFRGLSPKSFDGRGNYALGVKEQIIFPEINYDKVDEVRGMDIIICTTAATDKEGRALLKGFDLPFIKN